MTQTHSTSTSIQALQALRRGEAIVFPTDTLFGLGVSVCHASSPEALYEIKHREKGKPIAWLVNSVKALDTYAKEVPAYVYTLAKTFWPGPLTIIVRANSNAPSAFCSNEGTVGLRMPANEIACKLIDELGCPIATTSANISGQTNACSFAELDQAVLDSVSVALDDGVIKDGVASTVLDCASHSHPRLLRIGAIAQTDIESLL